MIPLARALRDYLELPPQVREEWRRDWRSRQRPDPGLEHAVRAALSWLAEAQDNSCSRDGGVARHFSLTTGWAASYPETSGYIVPTLLQASRLRGDELLPTRARRILDWLVGLQFPSGAFPGGMVGERPVVPVTFNTGQILLGLAAGTRELGESYREPLRRAARWLVETQDEDGAWRRFPSPFAVGGEKAYESHVAWGLLEAARVEQEESYVEGALANLDWTLRQQRRNGWFSNCCLTAHDQPLTHTLGYVLRGVIEGYRFSGEQRFLESSVRTANALLRTLRPDGFLPGRLDSDWRGTVSWACLTGSVQIAICWMLLNQLTGDDRYLDPAFSVNRYVRSTLQLDAAPGIRGGVKGSFPIYGGYGRDQYLSWAAKFFIDSNLMEAEIRGMAV